ncbi:MAG: DEAD/DEAH box helicase, partial [Propionibacteriaceae bacterium]|nr:DEAD/DEAH box helicase [Propionibacteriaceae bacterium]
MAEFMASTQAWFRHAFAGPTQVQTQAWEQIRQGKNALVIAPTGSGKTLAAFLYSIDSLLRREEVTPGVKVLYVSPLKALAVDVERNLGVPLNGILNAALEQGTPRKGIHVGMRIGDTPAPERRKLAAKPPQILITTPESLFLMLSSSHAS